MSNSLTTILGIVVAFDGFKWFVGLIPTLYYAFTKGYLPTLVGARLLGGPFEKLGMESLIVTGIGFATVSALKFLAAYWIGSARKDGAILELILLGLSAFFRVRLRAAVGTADWNHTGRVIRAHLEKLAFIGTYASQSNAIPAPADI